MKSKMAMSLLVVLTLMLPSAVLSAGMKKNILEKPQPTFPREEEKDMLDFRKLDKNNNLSVSRDEFNADKRFDPKMFDEIDTNKDGYIGNTELRIWLRARKNPADSNLPPAANQKRMRPSNGKQIIDSNSSTKPPPLQEVFFHVHGHYERTGNIKVF